MLLKKWIESMTPLDDCASEARLVQVYVIERDAGLICRILGLYAARSLDIVHMNCSAAMQGDMTLCVGVSLARAERGDAVETLRVLAEKAATLVGVLAVELRTEAAVLS